MRTPTLRILTYFTLLAALLAQLFAPLVAYAENGQALSITPPVVELSADPGQSLTATIKLTNVSSGDLLIKNQINDFGAKDETGEPNIIFDYTQETPYSLRNWVTAPDPFVLGSKQAKQVQFQINVPKDAEPGGHYAVFRFTGQAPELQETGVAISASLGALVLLKVSGNVTDKSSVSDFYSADQNFAKQSFFENGPISFVERIRNEGNIHDKPTGTIDIKDSFGNTVDSLRVNGDPANSQDPPRSVLPQSIRRFEQTLNRKWMFGRYTANLNLSYGPSHTPLTSTIVFWVIPYKLILLVLVLIVLLFLLFRWLMKRYKQHIIQTAHKQHLEQNSVEHPNSQARSHLNHPKSEPKPPQQSKKKK